jgi:hypothetical protein
VHIWARIGTRGRELADVFDTEESAARRWRRSRRSNDGGDTRTFSCSGGESDPLTKLRVELNIGLMHQLNNHSELLGRLETGRPAPFAAHDEVVAVAIGLSATGERDARALQGAPLSLSWTWFELTLIAIVDVWMGALSLVRRRKWSKIKAGSQPRTSRKLMPTPA